MYLQCTTELTARQQKAVEDALLARLHQEPLEAIRIVELCQDAGITRRIFYRLFRSKMDVVTALIDHTLMEMDSFPIPEGGNELHRILSYCKANSTFLTIMLENNLGPLLMNRVERHIATEERSTSLWLRGMDQDIREEKILFMINGTISVLYRWHSSGYRASVEQMASVIQRLLTHPLIAPLPPA